MVKFETNSIRYIQICIDLNLHCSPSFCPFRNVLWCKRQRNQAPPKCCAAVAHHGVTQGDVAIWCCTSCCICPGALKQCRITVWEMLCQMKWFVTRDVWASCIVYCLRMVCCFVRICCTMQYSGLEVSHLKFTDFTGCSLTSTAIVFQ